MNALGVARQAGKMGLHVTIVTKRGSNLACHSKYVKQHYYFSTDEELDEILRQNAQFGTMLYPTGDQYVEYLDKNRDWLEKKYYLAIPSSEVIQLFAEKSNSYRFAEQHKIPYPRSFYMDTEGKIANADKLTYPVVLKPSVMYDFREKFGKKAYICESATELKEKCEFVKRAGYPLDKMIAQEFMNGGPACLYSVGLFAVNGEIRKQIQVNRIRQRPMVLGNSTTYCISSNIKQLYEYAEKIVRLTNYTGVAEIEFMYHNGEYKFLEVNMRSWKWHTISNMYGFSFLGEWVNYLNNKESNVGSKEENAAWVERITDMTVSISEILHGRMSFWDYAKSYCRRKEYAVWSWADMRPAIVYPMQILKNIFNKRRKRTEE